MEKHLILVINPGSTSTKLALYEGPVEKSAEEISHPYEETAGFGSVADQLDYRMAYIEDFLQTCAVSLGDISAIAARGGLMRPVAGGVYRVSEDMVDDLKRSKETWGREHASSLGPMLAYDIHDRYGVPAFTADPVVTDEMDEVARVSGVPEIRRRSLFHALNVKAAARLAAGELGGVLEDFNFVVAHVGGGVSIVAMRRGRAVDVNNALLGMGPFSPQRAGALPIGDLVGMCYDGGYGRAELERKLVRESGLKGLAGTSDVREIDERIDAGDEMARLALEAMAYQVGKEVYAMAGALSGDVDGVVLTGGVIRSGRFVSFLTGRVSPLCRVFVYPGESEMESLAGYAIAALEEKAEVMEYGQDS